MISKINAKMEYEKFIRESKGILRGFFMKKTELENFSEIQKEEKAYNSTSLGIKNVEISKIKGSVQKYMDFDMNFVPKNKVIEERWCSIYIAFLENKPIPPVELYKIKDSYFVYDGNHRISVANYMNFKSIEAEVKEFIPSGMTKEDVIYREKLMFEKLTGLEEIIFTETGQYERIKKEISDHKLYLRNKELMELEYVDAAKHWYEYVFRPIINILNENQISKGKNRRVEDLFIYLLDHKYYESEQKGKDVGFRYAIIDFVNRMKTEEKKALENQMNLNSNTKKNLKRLEEIDNRKKTNVELLHKKEIIERVINLKFDYNFLIVSEIENYMNKKKIISFEEGVMDWYEKSFLKKIEMLKKKINFLPEIYTNYFELLQEKEEKLFYSLQNYDGIYQKSQNETKSTMILIADYILEIFIPIVEILREREIKKKDFTKIYYRIQERYDYLLNYKKTTMQEAAELYFDSTEGNYRKIHEGFLFKFKNTLREKTIINNLIERLKIEVYDVDLLNKILEKYGEPKKYETIFKLEKAQKNYRKYNIGKDWLKDKVMLDLEKITKQEIFISFYKTENTIEKLDESKKELNIIDFYADIISYGDYLGKEKEYLDIIDLALEYIEMKKREN
ncbi:MAG: hypothetical protein B6I28_02565 [Fusobacteriia bacterium 4572_132]|nr:MAG: hypothetical protein B6I28_02565 [Fusobacteriia bacterium 4572_132]